MTVINKYLVEGASAVQIVDAETWQQAAEIFAKRNSPASVGEQVRVMLLPAGRLFKVTHNSPVIIPA